MHVRARELPAGVNVVWALVSLLRVGRAGGGSGCGRLVVARQAQGGQPPGSQRSEGGVSGLSEGEQEEVDPDRAPGSAEPAASGVGPAPAEPGAPVVEPGAAAGATCGCLSPRSRRSPTAPVLCICIDYRRNP
jgi:hypothetical protein